jgi:aquaporin Z
VTKSLIQHWREYLIEAAGLGVFMISAASFAALLEHPGSPLHAALPDPFLRRILMGVAMGLTAVGIIYSRWGRRSGAHINPSVTLTFVRLGKVPLIDGAFYVLAQFAGGILGMGIASWVLGSVLADPRVNYVATMPGAGGAGAAFAAETAISFVLILVVLTISGTPRYAHLTGLAAGTLVATWITIEAPLSGMSMNPARTFASAVASGRFTSLWIYFLAPPLGMLLAAQTYVVLHGAGAVRCAKLEHDDGPCIFCRPHPAAMDPVSGTLAAGAAAANSRGTP